MSIGGSLSITKRRSSGTRSGQETKVEETKENIRKKELEKELATTTGLTSKLDIETQNFIRDLLEQARSGVVSLDSEALSALSTDILERAKTAEADVTKQINAITEDARLQGEQQLDQLQTQLAQQAGGSLANTLVTSATSLGRANLESQLARTRGELNLNARKAVSEELMSSLTGVSGIQTQPLEGITQLLDVLKGSAIKETEMKEREKTTELELNRLLNLYAERTYSSQFATKGLDISGSISGGNA